MSGLTRMHTSISIREISRRKEGSSKKRFLLNIQISHSTIKKTPKLVRQSQNFLYNNPSQTEGEQVHNLFHI